MMCTNCLSPKEQPTQKIMTGRSLINCSLSFRQLSFIFLNLIVIHHHHECGITILNIGYQTNKSNTLFVSAHNLLEKVFANKGSVVQDINRIQTRGGLTTVH